MDRLDIEKNIVSTLLQNVEEHRQLLTLDADFFSDSNLRGLFVNLQNGVEPISSYKGTELKHSTLPSCSSLMRFRTLLTDMPSCSENFI